MAREGDIVIGHGRQMKIGLVFREFANCVWFDAHGVVRRRWFDMSALTPLHAALRPRSMWPEAGQLEQLEAEREEQATRAERVSEKAARRKLARDKKTARAKRKAAA